jgi:hypothetical protein
MVCTTQDYLGFWALSISGIPMNTVFQKLFLFPKRYVISYVLEYQKLDEAQKPSNPECSLDLCCTLQKLYKLRT